MTKSTIIRPERIFKMGAIELTDPAPEESPESALQYYVPNYPHLATATVSEPYAEGERLVYEVQKPVVQTKG